MAMEEKRLPFLEHLEELKKRVIWSVIALVVGVVVCFFFHDQILDIVARPLFKAMKGNPELHFQSPTDVFFVQLKLALVAGIIVTAPFWLVQIWLFVAPGLYSRERNTAVGFVFFGTLFFACGVAFAYFVVFRFGFSYLLNFAYDRPGGVSLLEEATTVFNQFGTGAGVELPPATRDATELAVPIKSFLTGTALEVDYDKARFIKAAIKPTIMMDKYVSLVLKLLLAFGVVFELPLILYLLARLGLVNHRGLLKFFRYWVVLSFLISAVLTPPDVITQTLMAGPLILMYLMGIVVAFFITRKRERLEREEAARLGYTDEDDEDDEDADAEEEEKK